MTGFLVVYMLAPSSYGRQLNDLFASRNRSEPWIGCSWPVLSRHVRAKRFHVLSEHVKDAELAEFYHSLFESEARHHTTYTRLAKDFASEDVVMSRLDELALPKLRSSSTARSCRGCTVNFEQEETE